jgi:hypothetical protein
MRNYKIPLETLLKSIGSSFNIIIVYQGENEDKIYKKFDGTLCVHLKRNIYEYGSFIGLHMLFEKGFIPSDSKILLLHDTCKAGKKFKHKLQKHFKETTSDITFMCNTGQCNICIVNKNAIYTGYEIYRDIYHIDKQTAIDWEWNHTLEKSIKSLPLKIDFLQESTEIIGKRKVYLNNERNILYYKTLDLEKYYRHAQSKQSSDTP